MNTSSYKNFSFLTLTLLFVLTNLYKDASAQPRWQDLIKDNSLNGWSTVGGDAPYKVEDGVIIGTAVKNSPNTFLVTGSEYSDFILEFDVFVDSRLNSGVQIRSASDKNYRKGVFHGYQVEIDPSERSWSGGIYDEQRRGWLYPLSRNTKAQDALKMGQWNTVRIEAIGNSINTWINGVHCARLTDAMSSKGKIGLQIHSIGQDSDLEGAQVKWRNIRLLSSDLSQNMLSKDPAVPEISYLKNQLTHWEQKNGFRLLWDGLTPNGWRGAKRDDFPQKGWEIKDGVLTVLKTDGGESTGPGDIVTTNNYSDFELVLDFKITEGANSGIKYFVDPGLNKEAGSAIGCEFQILDDAKHPDAKQGVNGNRTVGSLYDLIAAENLSFAARAKQFKGVGEWNRARIVSKDGKVEHWLNEEKVVEYDRFSQMFKALVAYSKYAQWKDFGQWPKGSILLQDHGDEVSFHSIKIREFNGL